MARNAALRLGLLLVLAALAAAPGQVHAQAQPTPPARTTISNADFRAAFRAQVEDELAQLRPRLTRAEADAKAQAERYQEMAAAKVEAGKKAADKAQATRERTDKANARSGYTPKMPDKAGGAGKKGAAADPKAGAGEKPKSGGEAGAASASAEGAPKKIDPVLTQQFLAMGLRDQVRQLRDRIAYLESLLARL